MAGGAPEDGIVVAAFDPATGVIIDPDGRRIALLDPDGNFSVNAVATLYGWIAGGDGALDALIAVCSAIKERRGHLPPQVLEAVEGVARDMLQRFFDAGGSLD